MLVWFCIGPSLPRLDPNVFHRFDCYCVFVVAGMWFPNLCQHLQRAFALFFFLFGSGFSHQVVWFLKHQQQFQWLLVKNNFSFKIEAQCICTQMGCHGLVFDFSWLYNVPDRMSVATCERNLTRDNASTQAYNKGFKAAHDGIVADVIRPVTHKVQKLLGPKKKDIVKIGARNLRNSNKQRGSAGGSVKCGRGRIRERCVRAEKWMLAWLSRKGSWPSRSEAEAGPHRISCNLWSRIKKDHELLIAHNFYRRAA